MTDEIPDEAKVLLPIGSIEVKEVAERGRCRRSRWSLPAASAAGSAGIDPEDQVRDDRRHEEQKDRQKIRRMRNCVMSSSSACLGTRAAERAGERRGRLSTGLRMLDLRASRTAQSIRYGEPNTSCRSSSSSVHETKTVVAIRYGTTGA